MEMAMRMGMEILLVINVLWEQVRLVEWGKVCQTCLVWLIRGSFLGNSLWLTLTSNAIVERKLPRMVYAN